MDVENPLQPVNMNIVPENEGSPKKKSKKRLSVERIYQKKTQLEHILLRPDTYIGSVETIKQSMWVYDQHLQAIVNKEINFVPGLYKIFDEIIVNAADNKQRDPSMSVIKITIDQEGNTISIYNDGKGIPIEQHREQKVFVPTLIFGQLLTSSNYDDDQKKVTGGRNGYGAKLCNIFSTKFTVETCCAEYGKSFKQTWTKNMGKASEPQIKDFKGKDFTCVTFKPDLAKFNMEKLEDDMVALMTRRAFDIAGAVRGVAVYLNKEKLKVRSFRDYVELYLKAAEKEEKEDDEDDKEKTKPIVIHEVVNKRWEVCATLSEKGFQQASFVNSIATTKGGTHVNYVAEQLITKLMGVVKRKAGKGCINIKPFQIKNHLWLFINCQIENPAFDSQTKENMTLRAKAFGSTCELSEKFIKGVQGCGVVESIMNWVKFKTQTQLNKKCSATKHSKLKGIPKLDDANDAGSKNSQACTLILTEGDSAKTLAVSGLSVVGRDRYGVFPLRGKLLNVRDASHKQILDNAEINNLLKIVGLQYNKKYSKVEDLKTLRYGHVMIMTDQDQDGSHIKGLLINFIHSNWPGLMRLPFLEEFITPIVKVSKKNQEIPFYSIPEFEEWKSSTENFKSWKVKYYKGLGTSTPKEAKEYFADMDRHRITFNYDGPTCDEAILMAFSKKKVQNRKDWLNHGMEERKWRRQQGLSEVYLYEKDTKAVSYTDFVNKELILFSNADNERSIPSLVDGLKPGQRKVLYTCFKRNDKREVKVAQLSGSVAELSAYHHGEVSLHGTIINLAQNFVGSNNMNLLQPIGQFGTRLHGGKDAASPRYIFTMLSPAARLAFPVNDDHCLKYLMDDNQRIEPEWYCPILPMVLVNGADGIGTGYSTKIPNYDVRDICANLRKMMAGEEPKEMTPSYKNFTGTITQVDATRYSVTGNIEVIEAGTVEITELPIGTWTQPYKESVLEPMLHGTEKCPPCITDYKEYQTDTTVRFLITMTEEKLAEAEKMGLHKRFKLESYLNTSNMVLFDALGCLRKYEKTTDILKEFFTLRLERYGIRKAFLEGMLTAESMKLNNQARFILEKIEGKIVIENRSKRDVVMTLVQRGYDSDPVKAWKDTQKYNAAATDDDDGDDASSVVSSTASGAGGPDFNYLLQMALLSLSKEKKEELLKEKGDKAEELRVLRGKTLEDLWTEDLDCFLEELEQLEQQEREEELLAIRSQAGKRTAGKRAVTKPKPRKPKAPAQPEKADKEIKKEPKKVAKATTEEKDPWSVEEDSGEPVMLSLAERIAKKKVDTQASSSSTAAKKQSTLDGFRSKASTTQKSKSKKKMIESDEEDLVMEFSDTSNESESQRSKRAKRGGQTKKYMFSSDEDSDGGGKRSKPEVSYIPDDDASDDDNSDSDASADFLVQKPRVTKKTGAAKKPSSLDTGSESDKSDVQATRALIQKLSPAKASRKLEQSSKSTSETSESDAKSCISDVVNLDSDENQKPEPKKKVEAKKARGKQKLGDKQTSITSAFAAATTKGKRKPKNSGEDKEEDNTGSAVVDSQKKKTTKGAARRPTKRSKLKVTDCDSDSSEASVKVTKVAKQHKINSSPPKKKKIESEEGSDDDDVPLRSAASRPQRSRKTAAIKYSFSDSEEEVANKKDDSWDLDDFQ